MKRISMSMRMFRRIAFGVTAAAAATALAACGSSAQPSGSQGPSSTTKTPTFSLAQPGYLTISTYGSNPPVNIDNPDGTEGGIEGSLLTSFAKDYGLKVKLTPTTFASMILDVQQGHADMGLFVYWNADRSKQLYYTTALTTIPLVVFTKKGFAYNGPDSMKGHKIGVVVGQLWADQLKKEIGSDAVLFQGQPQAAQALLNGQIDGYMNGLIQMYSAPLSENQNAIKAHTVKPGDWGIPDSMRQNVGYNVVSCSNSALAKALDEHVAALTKSGEWGKIFSSASLPSGFLVKDPTPPTQGCGA